MDNGFCMLLQLPALRGQLDIVPYPAEQRFAKRLFQLPDAGADGRLGDAQFVRGPAEMAGAYHSEKRAQQFGIHVCLPVEKRS
jgi:hypothetical protein